VAVDEGDRVSEYSTRLRAECQCYGDTGTHIRTSSQGKKA
jgi:hypothetical protein